ncbi:bifunctional phosphoribosylaminoimidazolecarboxamide formyltransferase/IMP cyclohydrolase [Paenactinomyces guangxiensis]|uniref:Bifunctional purine biosynthesis protein PurH n=1 Tax=Paenactinomyces guangxiensis TaxID=1490290 RepID=A0A7W2AA18_9BACL|nr:bifunctional phosphoribosylaminoimidazolecarboxamide formyltransferase/IMP cyclohydrolase [Paenactinomyces guangxiensis]MBA4495483.1 bifunctional phosphoribosylaminoimidazolecarboxamide formyltransferase/IMP cyclohydrolase [Paenactinomyces guangxiensis]MBH8592394.1 bifunctional phosphoribosylaminoimidazolecarboxamide formyltransferase/IMP cyclohydrolase [Paenactinomyces guangxiensis]
MNRIRRALISVSDKNGIVELAQELARLDVEIISTGGTCRLLQEAGVPVTGITEVTQFPEIMDGRVKTLHPKVHGGLLAIRDKETHQKQMKQNGIEAIDLVVVNLYPFQQTIAKPDHTYEQAIENIDIGGPSMVRSAAKNHRFVTVVVDPADYSAVIEQIKTSGATDESTRRRLAAKAFSHTAAYDALISGYLNQQTGQLFPDQLTVTFNKQQTLRYGENPHQRAAFYRQPLTEPGQIASAEQLHGKELSYNNINDANAALELAAEFDEPVVVAVKHMNPCGVGIGQTVEEAFQKAYEADPVSIFGGIIATNQPVNAATAEKMKEIFLEIIIAPSFEEEALSILKTKKNLRLLQLGDVFGTRTKPSLKLQTVGEGVLVQESDITSLQPDDCKVVTEREPNEEEWTQLLFAWKVVKHVKSNAIVLAKDSRTLGVGAGQMNRVGSAAIAIEQAGENSRGAVMASDAFFPMKDTVEKAAAAGVTAIIQPGGSIRDQESIDEANKHGIAMVFTGIRHFKH